MNFLTWCKSFFKSVGRFLVPFVKSFLTAVGPILAESAIRAVQTVEANYRGAGGDEKRKAAFKLIKNDLEEKAIHLGVSVSAQMINRAIEAALAKLEG